MADSCALAREKLARTVSRMRPAGTLEKATTLIKTGFLGSVVTPLKAVGGNALSLGYRTVLEHPVRAGVDYLHAVAKSALDHNFSLSPDEYRTMRFSLNADGIGRLWSGLKAGAAPTRLAIQDAAGAFKAGTSVRASVRNAVATFADQLNTRLNAEQVNRTLDYREIKYQSPVVDAVVNSVMGVMEAVDRPYWRASHDFSLQVQARTLAAAEGLSGESFKARTAQLFSAPTDEMVFRAVDDANYATFKNKNFLSRMGSAVKRGAQQIAEKAPQHAPGSFQHGVEKTAQIGGKVGSYLLETNLPFTGVPSSVAGQAFSLSTGPLSLLRLLTNRNPAAVSRIVSDAALGSGIMALGYQLARDGKLTAAAPPPGTPERSQWDTEGKQAWSVQIGTKWIDTRFAAPISAPLYAGAALANSKGQSVTDRLMAGVGGTSQMLLQQTYLQNVNTLIDAMGAPQKKGARVIASQIPIPALSGQLARATDPIERQPGGVVDQVKSRIPILSRSLPPQVDALGREQRRTGLERASEVLSPARVHEGSETDVTREFQRLGVHLRQPGKSSTRKGVTTDRAPREQSAFEQSVGRENAAALGSLITSPQYRALSDDAKRLTLDKMQTRLFDQAAKGAVVRAYEQGTAKRKGARR